MKRFIILFSFVVLIFTGCMHLSEAPKLTIVSGYDFSKYANEDFLFTTESYNNEYKSLGLINIELYPEIKKTENETAIASGMQYFSNGMYIGKVSAMEAIDSMYATAKRMGADAVINFEVGESSYKNGAFDIPGVIVSGFAIKRN